MPQVLRLFAIAFILSPFAVADFPDHWIGIWKGEGVQLQIEVKDLDTYHWRLQYEGEPIREYVLKAVAGTPGHYLVDEQNGIRILHTLKHGILSTAFTVNGKLITMQYQQTSDEMILLSASTFSLTPVLTTASGLNSVCSYGLLDLHRVVLYRQQPPQ